MSEKKMTSIGGQAIIEGVMMRGPEKIAMAVRKPDGEIIIEEKEEALCSGTLSVEELTKKSIRLPQLNEELDEKSMRWLELSEFA